MPPEAPTQSLRRWSRPCCRTGSSACPRSPLRRRVEFRTPDLRLPGGVVSRRRPLGARDARRREPVRVRPAGDDRIHSRGGGRATARKIMHRPGSPSRTKGARRVMARSLAPYAAPDRSVMIFDRASASHPIRSGANARSGRKGANDQLVVVRSSRSPIAASKAIGAVTAAGKRTAVLRFHFATQTYYIKVGCQLDVIEADDSVPRHRCASA